MSIIYFLLAGLFFLICKVFVDFCATLQEGGQ